MIAVDTNILIYAHREETPQHQQALERLSSLAAGRNPWAIPLFCIGEFIRVVTHPKVFAPPTSMDMALAALGGLLESPSVRVLNLGPEFLNFYRTCLAGDDARGNLAFDAQFASSMV